MKLFFSELFLLVHPIILNALVFVGFFRVIAKSLKRLYVLQLSWTKMWRCSQKRRWVFPQLSHIKLVYSTRGNVADNRTHCTRHLVVSALFGDYGYHYYMKQLQTMWNSKIATKNVHIYEEQKINVTLLKDPYFWTPGFMGGSYWFSSVNPSFLMSACNTLTWGLV